MVAFIPLFLESDALALYLEVKDDQSDSDKFEELLKEAFSDGAFVSFREKN